jgi:biotin carboxyl carrier protein
MEDKMKFKNNGENKPAKTEPKIKYKTLVVQGTKYRTLFTKKYLQRKKWGKPDEKHLFAYIPGTINEIFVKEGDPIKKEDKLLILEAMKMKNTIFSPIDGIVKSIHVKSGDIVPKGFLMLEFE